MTRATTKTSIGIFALVALAACASQNAHKQQPSTVDQCPPPNTLTCDRFAGENYNCTCERSDRLEDILDSY